MGFSFANEVLDSGCTEHDFQSCTSTATHFGKELLCDDGFESITKKHSDLVLLIAWEDVDNSVDGGRTVSGVKRAKHEVSRFREGKCSFDCFEVSKFTHKHDVRVFSEDSP